LCKSKCEQKGKGDQRPFVHLVDHGSLF
jgi:hypothetical protein